jgi:hypothetical protein
MCFVVNEVSMREVFLPVLQLSPVSIIPPMLHTHSFIYHWHCIMCFSQYFSFPLSVSFHHCFILIRSSTTDAVYCFSPSTSVSPVSIVPPILHTHSFSYCRRSVMFFSQYFSFPVSVSLHQRSILIIVYMLLLPQGQTGEAWEPSNNAVLFQKSGSIGLQSTRTL